MEKSISYMRAVLARINSIRYDSHMSHGTLMAFAGFISAGVALDQLTYKDYEVLMNIARNAYENNPSKLP